MLWIKMPFRYFTLLTAGYACSECRSAAGEGVCRCQRETRLRCGARSPLTRPRSAMAEKRGEVNELRVCPAPPRAGRSQSDGALGSGVADVSGAPAARGQALLRDPKVQRDGEKRREVIKKVIYYMTLGVDVSKLFSEMVMVGPALARWSLTPNARASRRRTPRISC
jgi:hypothetical protein